MTVGLSPLPARAKLLPPPNAMTLDDLARDPSAVIHLAPNERAQFLALALVVVGALAAPAVTTNGAHAHDAEQPDRWLKDEEAAALLSVSTRWLRRHGANLPFRRSLSGKIIRYSEAGLRRWQTRQRPLLCIVYDIVSRAMQLG